MPLTQKQLNRVRAIIRASDGLIEPEKMPRRDGVLLLMYFHGYTEDLASLMYAMRRGEITGDIIEVDNGRRRGDEPSQPSAADVI
jgi:hypothetical protein